MSLIFLNLMIVLVVVCAIAVLVFLQVAFTDERKRADQIRESHRWRPPFVRAETLRDWAAATAEQTAQRWLTRKPSAKTPVGMVAELQHGATEAMLPLTHSAERRRIVPCSEPPPETIRVTAPEALRIADYVRRQLPEREQRRIHRQAIENCQRLALRDQGEKVTNGVPCPLLGKGNICCVDAAHPLRCRPRQTAAITESMGDRAVDVVSATGGDVAAWEWTVEQGVEAGLTRALESAGLDSHLYELNSALLAALDTPNAAERWAKGEDIFGSCRSCERGALSSAV